MVKSQWCLSLFLLACLLSMHATRACAQTLYWTDRGSGKIQRASAEGSGIVDLVVTNVFEPVSIALDPAAGKMYWTDATAADFMASRANLDGSGRELLPISGGELSGIALDAAAGKLYWTDRGWGTISRANLDGTDAEVLVSGPSLDAIELALDVTGGKIYWTASAAGGSTISRANLDGTAAEVVVPGLLDPSGIALDLPTGKVYWTDIGAGKIQRANLDGNGIEDVITTAVKVPVRITLDRVARKIYWTEGSLADFMISRANLDGSGVEWLVTGLTSPSGIALVSGATTSVADGVPGDASALRLASAPNPFRSSVRISGRVPSGRGTVGRLAVLDLAGRIVHRAEVPVDAGRMEYEWSGITDSGARARAGLYRVQLRIGGLSGAAAVVLLE